MNYSFSIEILEEEYHVFGIEKMRSTKMGDPHRSKETPVDVTDSEIGDRNSDNYLYLRSIDDGWDVGSLHGQITQNLDHSMIRYGFLIYYNLTCTEVEVLQRKTGQCNLRLGLVPNDVGRRQ